MKHCSAHIKVDLRSCLCQPIMVSHTELQIPAVLLTIVGITIFADFWFQIHGFSGIISFTLQFNLEIYIQASCCYMAKCYLGALLLRQVVIRPVVTWRNVIWRDVTELHPLSIEVQSSHQCTKLEMKFCFNLCFQLPLQDTRSITKLRASLSVILGPHRRSALLGSKQATEVNRYIEVPITHYCPSEETTRYIEIPITHCSPS